MPNLTKEHQFDNKKAVGAAILNANSPLHNITVDGSNNMTNVIVEGSHFPAKTLVSFILFHTLKFSEYKIIK